MAKIVQLEKNRIPKWLRSLMPHCYCVGLLTEEDVIAAGEVAPALGGRVIDFPYPVRQQPGLILKGIVVYQAQVEGFTFCSRMNLMRLLCNNIDARSSMLLWARDEKKHQRPIKPWMLKLRPVEGKQIRSATSN